MDEKNSLKDQILRDLKQYRKIWIGLLFFMILVFLAGLSILIFMAEKNDGQLPFFYVIH